MKGDGIDGLVSRGNMNSVRFDFSAYSGRRVLVTRHTGFKGAWLCEWLLSLGAEVYGFSKDIPTRPSLFAQLQLARRIHMDIRGDVRDRVAVRAAVESIQPDFVFHLAAQPLVRLSYERPVETFDTNVMGTVNVLDALRGLEKKCSAVLITTDKCYENRETSRPYREDDPMGGYDPYSCSKGCDELVISSYHRSFFGTAASPVWIASARAGNVIGGGDWANGRFDGVTRSSRSRPASRPRSRRLFSMARFLFSWMSSLRRPMSARISWNRPGRRRQRP